MFCVKIGGGEGNASTPVLEELAAMWRAGRRWVLVHGGSARTDQVAAELGRPSRFVTSPSGFVSRYTDRETALLLAMVYSGDVSSRLVEQLQGLGVDAVGLSGLDGRLLQGRRKVALRVVEDGRQRMLRDTFTGTVEGVNDRLLRLLLDAGHAPVISPPALGEDSEILNVDADRAAAAVAVALGVDDLLLLTGAPGLLRNPAAPESLVPQLCRCEIDEARDTYAQGRMRIKLQAAGEALDGGVERVVIAASNRRRPVTEALAGTGTVLR